MRPMFVLTLSLLALSTTGCSCSTSFGGSGSGSAQTGDLERMRTEMNAATGPTRPGDEAAALPAAEIVTQLGLPVVPRKQTAERRTYADGSWSVVTFSDPEKATLTDPIFMTEARVYPDEAAARAGFEWYERSRGVELSWSDLEFEPPSYALADGGRWNQMAGGAPGGGTEAVIMVRQRGRVLVYGLIGNLRSLQPADIPYEGVLLPALTRALDGAAKLGAAGATP